MWLLLLLVLTITIIRIIRIRIERKEDRTVWVAYHTFSSSSSRILLLRTLIVVHGQSPAIPPGDDYEWRPFFWSVRYHLFRILVYSNWTDRSRTEVGFWNEEEECVCLSVSPKFVHGIERMSRIKSIISLHQETLIIPCYNALYSQLSL